MQQSLYEVLRRYEFKKTEPETLVGLIDEAIRKGEDARVEQAQLRKVSGEISVALGDVGYIRSQCVEGSDRIVDECAAGIDGSHQPVGGVGGKWYVPLSCALVVFGEGIKQPPSVEVDAHIITIREEEFRSVGTLSSEAMLTVETKAVMRWAMRNKRSFLFIDGPIVDPPLCSDKRYIQYRCSAVRECLKRDIRVVGCVKRVKDSHLIDHLCANVVGGTRVEAQLRLFPSDLQLVAFLFAHRWRSGIAAGHVQFTKPIDVSHATPVHRLYHRNGIRVFSTFIQKSLAQYVLRLDVPVLEASAQSEATVDASVAEAVAAAAVWTYPEHDIPLPVFIAHAKCEVRRGCAEVLYQEIMARTRMGEPIDQIVALQLEARL